MTTGTRFLSQEQGITQEERNAKFEKEIKRVYQEIDKFSNLAWAQKSVHELYWKGGRQGTRSNDRKEDKEAHRQWKKETKAQLGYGEITRVSIFILV